MRHIAIALLAIFLAPPALAQTVQKCVAPNGQARYQSEPCERGMRTAEVWDAEPEPEPVRSTRSASSGTPVHERRRRAPSRSSRMRTSDTAYAPDTCAQARAYRDEAERRAGLARNYDLLSTLQRRVYEACR